VLLLEITDVGQASGSLSPTKRFEIVVLMQPEDSPKERRRTPNADLRLIQELQRKEPDQVRAEARVWRNGYTLLLTGTSAVLTLAAPRLGSASWPWRLALSLSFGVGILLLAVALWLVLNVEGGEHKLLRGFSLDSVLDKYGSVQAFLLDEAAQVRKRIRRSKIWAKLGALAVFIGLILTLWIPS